MKRAILFIFSHGFVFVAGFGLGIYLLPILTAPTSPDMTLIAQSAQNATVKTEFIRDLKGSDFLHWGTGEVSITETQIVHDGELAPGPDYKLYLTREFVDDEASFNAIKETSLQIADIKTFNGFIVDRPEGIDFSQYAAIVVWCESFGEFITAARL